ncbi:hypothetical protein K435DRAFT_798545 [Dendrothele bispora CBS 962.96]|uniref:Uncharacterized protein n=1 Tax=Dendrothele bispora (strain CBS 962.96) TaxID=1314807 RepID=A0A4S8LYU3_DENBC|nr:hypothetical protein K435DRAFT_798545 [Dendrothele bispora CBS 962.96]
MSTAPPPGALPATTSTNDADISATSLSWEGDKMFNIYIYDYCFKRGYKKTARELLQEAGIPPESHPPIDARQGLLFEWWSVFWVLFTAKANGGGSEEALLYTQYQAQQTASRAARLPSAAGTAPQGVQPIGRPAVNGVQQRPFMSGSAVSMPNGVGPNANGMPHMNGMPASGQAPSANSSSQPGQPLNFQPGTLQGQPPRNQLSAPGPGPRAPNGLPFQSPTMAAHSPQTSGAQGPQPPQHPTQQHHSQSSMNQLTGRSPHQAGMLPPNAPGAPGQPSGTGPNQTATATFQQPGRPPSRSVSPGQNNMMTQPSPSMANRQAANMPTDQTILVELRSLAPNVLEQLKREAGVDIGKDLNVLTPDERRPLSQRAQTCFHEEFRHPDRGLLSETVQRKSQPENPPGVGSSPPDPKRIRRSPMDNSLGYSQPSMQPGQQSGGPVGPPQPGPPMQNGMLKPPMAGGPPMGASSFMPQGMPNNVMGQPSMGVPQHPMNNMGVPMPGQGNMMGTQMQNPTQNKYNQGLPTFYRNNMPGMPPNGSDPTFGGGNMAGPRPGGGPPFDSNPANRGKPPMGMLPPPSPGMKDTKDTKPDGSPHTAPNPGRTPTATGTAASTPSNPPAPLGPSLHQPGQQSQGPTPNPSQSMEPSPTSMLGGQSMSMGPPSSNADLFTPDFLNNVAGALDDFDTNLFRPEGDINFERDFGQWFNQEDVGGALD